MQSFRIGLHPRFSEDFVEKDYFWVRQVLSEISAATLVKLEFWFMDMPVETFFNVVALDDILQQQPFEKLEEVLFSFTPSDYVWRRVPVDSLVDIMRKRMPKTNQRGILRWRELFEGIII